MYGDRSMYIYVYMRSVCIRTCCYSVCQYTRVLRLVYVAIHLFITISRVDWKLIYLSIRVYAQNTCRYLRKWGSDLGPRSAVYVGKYPLASVYTPKKAVREYLCYLMETVTKGDVSVLSPLPCIVSDLLTGMRAKKNSGRSYVSGYLIFLRCMYTTQHSTRAMMSRGTSSGQTVITAKTALSPS